MDNAIFCLAIALGCGLLFNRIAKKVGLPNVTGYLVAGLIIGGSFLKIIPFETVDSLNSMVTVALGFIAFSIGGEFKISHIKKLGARIITVTCFESLTAVLLVDVVLLLCRFPTPEAIALGAIAAATAPAATLMVVRQYKADGPVTRALLPVVAMDDAVCLIAFSISVSIAKSLDVNGDVNYFNMLIKPLIEIVSALAIGGAVGFVMTYCLRFFKSRANRLTLVICAVFLGTALADMLGLSSLLLCMMIGAMVANLYNDLDRLLDVVDHWTPPLFLLFFVLSGADLDISVLPKVGLLGVLYLVLPLGGQLPGRGHRRAYLTEPNVQKYLGVALLPQAGVAIGMTTIAAAQLPEYGRQIRAVILCATLIYELAGPVLTKIIAYQGGRDKARWQEGCYCGQVMRWHFMRSGTAASHIFIFRLIDGA